MVTQLVLLPNQIHLKILCSKNQLLALKQVYTLCLTHDNRYTIIGTPKEIQILQTHAHALADAITHELVTFCNHLYAKRLISDEIRSIAYDHPVASDLLFVIQQQLRASFDPESYLRNVCHILFDVGNKRWNDIATSILYQLGECNYN